MPNLMKNITDSYIVKKLQYWLAETPSENPAVPLPFFKIVMGPFNSFIDNFRSVVFFSLPYALILTLLALSMGYGQMCYFDGSLLFCSQSGVLYAVYQLFKFIIWAIFITAYYNYVYEKAPFKLWYLDKRVVKVFFFNLFSVVMCLLPVLSFYLLMQREPNPDWRIELGYFGIVSIGFLMPFVLLRLYSWLAFAATGEKMPGIGVLWRKNSGNMLKLILGFFLMLLTLTFFGSSLVNYYNGRDNMALDAFSLEFLMNLLILAFLILACANAYIQKEYLFPEKTDGE